MTGKRLLLFSIPFGACVLAIALMAQQPPPTEAPAGFDTPTLQFPDAGSQSSSNGIPEPAGDTFALDQQVFERREDAETFGLGPVFNATTCSECHQNPVTGGPSQITEIRAGHKDSNGNFVNPTVTINDGQNTISGRSIINDRATCPQAQEQVPDTETIVTRRAVLNTLGDGFVEAIDDNRLLDIAANQPRQSNGTIHGQAVEVPILETSGLSRVGRFGWKDQHGSLLSFTADAYLNEMGVTSRLKPTDNTTVCKVKPDPEDTPDDLGLANIDHFAQFMRGTKVPPRDTNLAGSPDATAGEALFTQIGCVICHVDKFTTLPAGTVINGNFTIPDALGNKIIHPYSDFLLHDVGTGDGIVQGGPPDTANKMRTQALWGVRTKARFMHDLASTSLFDAINRHKGEASAVIRRFNTQLTDTQRNQIVTFLRSL
jgi:CxxC motif-containing protein (DUF1111 family)